MKGPAAFVLAILACAPGSLASPPPDGTVEIPVGDLVRDAGAAVPFREDQPSPMRPGGSGGFLLEDDSRGSQVRSPAVPAKALAAALDTFAGGVRRIRIEIRGDSLVVPADEAETVRAGLARIRAARPRPMDLEFALEVSPDGKAWKTALAADEPILPGERKVLSAGRDRSLLTEFDVEIATASVIEDPILQVQRTGACAAIRVLPLPSGLSAVVDADIRIAEPVAADPIQTRHADWPPFDRCAVASDEAHAAFRVDAGQESVHEWTGRGGRRVRLRLRLRWQAPVSAAAETGALIWSPLLVQPLFSRRQVGYLLKSAGAEVDERWIPGGTLTEASRKAPEIAAARLEGKDAGWSEPTPSGLVVFGGKEAAAGRDALAAALEEEFRGGRVSVVVTDIAAGAPGPAGGREVFRASGPLLAGLGACFLSSDSRTFLQDADVEVASGSAAVDPVIGLLRTGTFCNLTLPATPPGLPAVLDLDLQFSRLESMGSVVLPLRRPGGRTPAVGEWKDEKGTSREIVLTTPGADAAPASYAIEKPECVEVRVAGLFPLDDAGRLVLRRTAPGFLAEGRELLVEIQAH